MEHELGSLLAVFSGLEAREIAVEEERAAVIRRMESLRVRVAETIQRRITSVATAKTIAADTRALRPVVMRMTNEALALERTRDVLLAHEQELQRHAMEARR